MECQVILEPGIGQFREFESPRVHTRINSWGYFIVHKLTVRIPPSAYSYKFVGVFSCAQIDLRKARERESATLDENRQEVGLLNPMRDKN